MECEVYEAKTAASFGLYRGVSSHISMRKEDPEERRGESDGIQAR